jgi:hypothetical protein
MKDIIEKGVGKLIENYVTAEFWQKVTERLKKIEEQNWQQAHQGVSGIETSKDLISEPEKSEATYELEEDLVGRNIAEISQDELVDLMIAVLRRRRKRRIFDSVDEVLFKPTKK